MLASIITAILDFLLGLWKEETHTVGEDAPANPGLRAKLNDKLAAWKAKTGAP